MEVIYIHALGCMTCMRMHEKVLELQNHMKIPVKEYNIDFDDVPFQDLGEYFPVTILIKDQDEVKRFIGEWELEDIAAIIRRYDDE